MGGKQRTEAENITNASANRFNKMSDDLYGTSKADTAVARNYYTDIAAGGATAQRAVAPQVEQIKNQYRLGREQLERTLPRGGALQKGMRDLTVGEFGDVGQAYTSKINEAIAALSQMGLTGTNQALNAGQGSLSAADILAKMAGDKANAWGQGIGGVASGIGSAAVLL